MILLPNSNDGDEFTIEMGWSQQARFPELRSRPSLINPSESAFDQVESIFRLPQLSRGRDYWWTIGKRMELIVSDPLQAVLELTRKISDQEAEAEVEPKCEEAVREVVQYGIPFLNKFLSTVPPLAS